MHTVENQKRIDANPTAFILVNTLTVTRALASFFAVVEINNPQVCVAALAYAAATDVFDGPIARATNTDTFKGSIYDNLADLCMRKSWESVIMIAAINCIDWEGLVGLQLALGLAMLGILTYQHSYPWVEIDCHILIGKNDMLCGRGNSTPKRE